MVNEELLDIYRLQGEDNAQDDTDDAPEEDLPEEETDDEEVGGTDEEV